MFVFKSMMSWYSKVRYAYGRRHLFSRGFWSERLATQQSWSLEVISTSCHFMAKRCKCKIQCHGNNVPFDTVTSPWMRLAKSLLTGLLLAQLVVLSFKLSISSLYYWDKISAFVVVRIMLDWLTLRLSFSFWDKVRYWIMLIGQAI